MMLEPERIGAPRRPESSPVRRCGCGGRIEAGGECAACRQRRLARERAAPAHVHDVLAAPGRPLPADDRASMERRLNWDFGRVRIHTDARAGASASALGAAAYATGDNVVFGPGRYAPQTPGGQRLLAHELAHVMQQSGAPPAPVLRLGRLADPAEREADAVARAATGPVGGRPAVTSRPGGVIRRQLITPLAPGGGFGGLMDRDRARVERERSAPAPAPTSATPFQVCSRDLQGVLGYVGNHAYIEAPPYRYAVITPLCAANWYDNFVTGTTAQKWDNSPDPCGKSPNCVPCHPAPGVTNVASCLRAAFTAYSHPSLYRGLGPNSNTFAGTLARSCCAGMVPKPSALRNCPAWDDAPAPARAGASPCPPGPSCR